MMDRITAMSTAAQPAMTEAGANGLEAFKKYAADLFQEWGRLRNRTEKTTATYTRNVRPFLEYLAARQITHPTPDDVAAYRDHLAESYKPSTVGAYLAAVKIFFRMTADAGLYPDIAHNVAGVKLDRGHKKDALSRAQAQDFLNTGKDKDTLKGLRDYAIMRLLLTAGLRTVEAVRANIGDKRTEGGHAVLYVQGKGRTERTEYVKLGPKTDRAIREYLAARGETDDNAPLFASTAHRNAGGRMTTRSISRIIKEHLQAAGLDSDRITAHSLRHTTGTLAIMKGKSLAAVQEVLRHRSVDTTRIYAGAASRRKNNTEDMLDKMFQ